MAMLRGGLARPRRTHRGRGFRHRERTGGKGAAQHLERIEGSGMFVRQPRRGPEHFRQKTQRRRRHEQEAQRGAAQARVVRECDRRGGSGLPQHAFRNAAGRAEDGRHNGRPAGTGNREGPCGPPRSGPARRAFRNRRAGRRFGGGAGRARTGFRHHRPVRAARPCRAGGGVHRRGRQPCRCAGQGAGQAGGGQQARGRAGFHRLRRRIGQIPPAGRRGLFPPHGRQGGEAAGGEPAIPGHEPLGLRPPVAGTRRAVHARPQPFPDCPRAAFRRRGEPRQPFRLQGRVCGRGPAPFAGSLHRGPGRRGGLG